MVGVVAGLSRSSSEIQELRELFDNLLVLRFIDAFREESMLELCVGEMGETGETSL